MFAFFRNLNFCLIFLLFDHGSTEDDFHGIIGRYLGCYESFSTLDQINVTAMNSSECIHLCSNYTFAALKKPCECHCGEVFNQSDAEVNCDVMGVREPKWGVQSRKSFSVFSTCRIGYHGPHCSLICSQCLSAIPCSRTTGSCLSGCSLNKTRDKNCHIVTRLNEINVAQNKRINYPLIFDRIRLGSSECIPINSDNFFFDFGHLVTIRNGFAVFNNIKGSFDVSVYGTRYVNKPLDRTIPSSRNGTTRYNFTNSRNHTGRYLSFQYSRQLLKNESICDLEVYVQDCREKSQCRQNEECIQLKFGKSSFRRCVCQKGFRRKSLTRNCEELPDHVNDCDLDLQKCNNETTVCRDTSTGYTCDCKSGFDMNNFKSDLFTCTDVDECASDELNLCDRRTATCHNEIGGYGCSCRAGYKPARTRGFFCIDVDECSDGELNRCDSKSTKCKNRIGSHVCQCKVGFQAIENNPRACKDIDECVIDQDACNLTSTNCINEFGSFSCKCKSGFARSREENSHCDDIDECLDPWLFGSGNDNNDTIDCFNLYGGYKLSCKVGYYNHSDGNKYECRGRSASIGLYSVVVISVVFIIVLLVLILHQIKRKKLKFSSELVHDDRKSWSFHHVLTRSLYDEKGGDSKLAVDAPTNTRIAMEDLEQWIEDAYNIETDGFKSEFEAIPKLFDKSMTYSKLEILKSKNRYKNICPYDDNRVILTKLEDDLTSDYINASFVRIGDNEATLPIIITQGPLKETIDDFWRLVVEYNVGVVVMLTDIVENDKIKCTKYWPDADSRIYGDVVVTKLSETNWKNFCKRTFALSGNLRNSSQATSEMTHWQFLSWPDHGVPEDVESVLEFYGKIRRSKSDGQRMLVHCSAGVGRTGCFAAIDRLLNEAASVGNVDVAGCVWELRRQRPYMVQSLKQYQFIYAVLKKSRHWIDSCINVKDFHSEFLKKSSRDSLGICELQEEFEKLKNDFPSDDEDIFLLDSFLRRPPSTTVFKATKIHGYSNASEFIVANYPEDWQVEKFWEIVENNDCLVLFIDHNEDDPPEFLPKATRSLHLGDLFVSTDHIEGHNFGQILRLKVTDNNNNNNNSTADHFYENIECIRIANGEERKYAVVHASSPAIDFLPWGFFRQVRDHVISMTPEEQVPALFVAGRSKSPMATFYVAASILLEQMNEHDEVDVHKILLKLRGAKVAGDFTITQYEELYRLIDLEIHHRFGGHDTISAKQRFSTTSRL